MDEAVQYPRGGRVQQRMTTIATTPRRLDEAPRVGPGSADPSLAALVARAGHGEVDAWESLVERYSRRVYALGLSRLRSREAAEDLTQSVFATLSEQLGKGAYREEGRFEAWLFRIANNRVRDEAKRAARRPVGGDASEVVAATSERASDDDLDALRRAVARLGEREQELLSLRHQAQLAFADIAELTGEPLGTLLARHHRALAKLRAMLDPEAGADA